MQQATQRMIAEMLGKQMGMGLEQVEGMLSSDPLAAICALSMTQPQSQGVPDSAARSSPDMRWFADRVAKVAMMVGACQCCLGEDPLCHSCKGTGRPGSRTPALEALLDWIELPLRRAGLTIVRSAPAASAAGSPSLSPTEFV